MKNDNFLPYLVVVGVVAIVAIVTLFLWSGRIEGAHSSKIFSPMAEDRGSCLDDDPTNDLYVPGIVTKAFTQYDDYCLNGKSLSQHYCELNYVKLSAPYDCPKGCLNGACVK